MFRRGFVKVQIPMKSGFFVAKSHNKIKIAINPKDPLLSIRKRFLFPVGADVSPSSARHAFIEMRRSVWRKCHAAQLPISVARAKPCGGILPSLP